MTMRSQTSTMLRLCAYLIFAGQALSGTIDGSVRMSVRSIAKRDGRDCGKFIMNCEKAAGACNNACYYNNCIDPNGATMVSPRNRSFVLHLNNDNCRCTTNPTTTTTTVTNLVAKPKTAPSATSSPSANGFTTPRIGLQATSPSIAMNGPWLRQSKMISKRAPSGTVSVASMQAKIRVCIFLLLSL